MQINLLNGYLIGQVDEPLVLARVPVVAARIRWLATVQAPDDPPISSDLGPIFKITFGP
jgi:hypothetical protein